MVQVPRLLPFSFCDILNQFTPGKLFEPTFPIVGPAGQLPRNGIMWNLAARFLFLARPVFGKSLSRDTRCSAVGM